MMRLAILGAGSHGRVVAESAAALGWSISFFDDVRTGSVDGHAVLGTAADLLAGQTQFDGVIAAIGDNRTRLDWILRLRTAGATITTIVDPSCRVSPSAHVGEGSFLACASIVGTGASLGVGCILNTAASVDHDCRLADAVHLSPGVRLSGNVDIGEASWLGTGSSVRNNIVIGRDVVAGVGSAVVGNIASGQTVVGVPARPLEQPN
ncbi:NeuD/PglB/VioB family sugar acetyltransferase [Devosia rhodophyticola]|uniref:NeuD/PglB/VioB family sugar acetyltransferase n=1 Tax=Devosia rhodophyticola TaxID=3026423 RepID=A0ABY7Z0U7_9HYPH|nr:NeuD/PglB/VioB family sugar acetyltransferase [Devosia rhodophyticola]WDR07280.1 NeuD/PglB/VioB family sugar acetyltransferase [Devosia rhodophyticola]